MSVEFSLHVVPSRCSGSDKTVRSKRRDLALTLAALAVPWLADGNLVLARDPLPLPVESALDTRSFSALSPIAFSRDGRWLAYMVRSNKRAESRPGSEIERVHYVRTGMELQNEASDIWISNTRTGLSKDLTGGKGSNWDPSWSPDGRYLAFLSDRDGSGQARLWTWDSTKDRLSLAATVNIRSPYTSPGIQWMPESRSVLLTTVPQNLSLSEYVETVMSSVSVVKQAMKDPVGATVTLYRGLAMPPGNVGAVRSSRVNLDAYSLADLVLIEIGTGRVTSVASGHRIGWYAASPDGSRVAYMVPKGMHPERRFRKLFDLLSMELATGQEHRLVSEAILTDIFTWCPDSTSLVYGAYESDATVFYVTPSSGGEARRIAKLANSVGSFEMPVWGSHGDVCYLIVDGALWRISTSAGEPQEVARVPGRKIVRKVSLPNGMLWSSDGRDSTDVITHDEAGKQDGFYRINLATGESTKLLEDGHCYECHSLGSGQGFDMVAAGGPYLAYTDEDAQHAPDLWISDSKFESRRQLTHLNPQFENYPMGSSRLVDWLSEDGKGLEGALLLPSDYRKGERYPLLVYVYPTTLSNQLDRFGLGNYPGPFNLQLFATRGYAVLLPDVREERDYGLSSIAKSVLPGVTKVVEMGIADPQRIGLMGHSLGGYATLALLVQTDRFRAALDASGFADYAEHYGHLSPDGMAWPADETEGVLGAAPWRDPFRYVWNSPIYYLDRVKTALLIVHGAEDSAVSASLADQVFVGMRRLGKEVEYARYKGESHVPRDWSYANQMDLCRRMLDWFDTRLKGERNDHGMP
jgi:dipeptidyl aminopeptidase/acylaminoacyl peptidase